MQRKEWYMVGYGLDTGGTGQLVHYTYERAKAAAGKYPVRRVVLDESWVEPEEEWVRPTDEDAKHWPRVEIRHEGDTDWADGYFLAAINHEYYVVMPEDALGKTMTMMYWHKQCRMKTSERQRWQSK